MHVALAELCSPGGRFAVERVASHGTTVPAIADVPPSVPAYVTTYGWQHRDATFLVAGAERLTFGEVLTAAEAVARALVARHGVRPGDRVGIVMGNSPAWVALYLGILAAGGIATLFNGWWQGEEIAAAIRDVDCRLVFADPARMARMEAGEEAGARVIVIDDGDAFSAVLAGLGGKGCDAAATLPVIAPDDPATILFTSGSTGRPKGVLSTHRAVVQAVFGFLLQGTVLRAVEPQRASPSPQPATLLNLPLFHVTASVSVLLQSFALGRKLVVMRRWDAEEAMRLIAAERVTYFIGVPTMSLDLLLHPDRAAFDLSSVTDFSAGGAARPPDHVARIAAAMPGAPLTGYGLTESNALGCANWRSNYLAKPASVGRPSAPLVEIAIVNAVGGRLGPGRTGEVAMRSVCNFSCYWGDPQATAAAFTADGFVLTGDLGHLDTDGYLFLTGRKKDIVIRGGENIGCGEVEAALCACPGVVEAAAFPLPDARLGEVPGAVVRLAEGAAVDAATLHATVSRRIAAFKAPARIWITTAPFPRLGSEKVDKAALARSCVAEWEQGNREP
ncbi:Acyl-CoA synthetase (AMP-forming)/AMP-acid ligase II [Sphingomonas gellani]|uniref:Acyl-CoA synthetase (AMP-forming)/AMP-acid ligase II n=2 Tax=Sphingomonas gellani TaxID=1166340 RepID=A0A1H8CD63_9SPHN|nr:Acyl-CoA synthetase (AMP-forming)/AMP-acid ligase II [Sphingomonas gellani]